MLVKCLAHGEGSGGAAGKYVMSSHDHKGIERAGVEVLRGDPKTFAALADSLSFKKKYTSVVVAWAPEDDPTPDEISAVVDDVERAAFAGLEPDSYHYFVVLHVESNGAKHVHILIPNVHLETGKAFNPAPPGWQKIFGPLRDAFNNEKGWARPDDPNRARLVQPKHTALINAAAVKAGLAVEPDSKDFLTKYLTQKVVDGLINNRADVLEALAELGEITRAGADYISVKPEGFQKAIRLKGVLFHEQFSSQSWIETSRKIEEGRRANTTSREPITQEHRERAIAARAALESAINRRVEYNKGRYKPYKRSPGINAGLESEFNERPNPSDQIAITDPVETVGNVGSTSKSIEDQHVTNKPENSTGQSNQRTDSGTRNDDTDTNVSDSETDEAAVALLVERFAGRVFSDPVDKLGDDTKRILESTDPSQDIRTRRIQSVDGRGLDAMQDGRQNNETMQKEGVLINDSIGKIALGAIRRINETIHFAVRRINKTISRFAVAIERNKSALDARTNRAAAGDAQQRNIYREIANFIAVSRLQTFESDLDADGTKVDLAKNKTGTGLENNRFTRPLSVDASDDVQRQREKQTFIDHRLQQAPKITDLERATAARPEEPQPDSDQTDMRQ